MNFWVKNTLRKVARRLQAFVLVEDGIPFEDVSLDRFIAYEKKARDRGLRPAVSTF